MGVDTKSKKTLEALLQQDPEVPMEDFTFDASEVIKEVKELKPGFEERVKELKIAEQKDVFEHTTLVQDLLHEKAVAEKTLKDAETSKATAMETIGTSSKELTSTTAQMTDDQAYL